MRAKEAEAMATIEFCTIEYEFSHDKAPRGRGTWAFALDRNTPPDQMFWTPSCTYAEAKKLAKAHFAKGAAKDARILVWVQP